MARQLIYIAEDRVLDALKTKLDEAGWEDQVRDVARGASLLLSSRIVMS
jgi:hypothetical protein